MTRQELPSGLVGLGSRLPIGVHVAVAVKGLNGAPTFGNRFWLMTPQTHTEEFTGRSGPRRDLSRAPAAGFEKWNAAAKALGKNPPEGPGRLGLLRGVLVHADLADAAAWRRGAYRLPEGHPNPKSRRHACVGDGVVALRYKDIANGEEQFARIACPNRECEFAMCGACRVDAHIIFQLRWDKSDPWEKEFPEALAHYDTKGWETVERIRGLFEYVLGTEALLTEEERRLAGAEEKAAWKRGLAQEFGIERVSLVGLPFTMTVSEKTRRADEHSPHGKRNTIVNFSWDGQLIPWLLAQREQRITLSGSELKRLPPTSVRDPLFEDGPMMDAVAEGFPGSGDHLPLIPPEPGLSGLDPSDGPAEVSGSGDVSDSPPAAGLPKAADDPVSRADGGESFKQGGEVPSTTQSVTTAERVDTARGSALTDAAPEVAQKPPGPRLLAPGRVADLKKLCTQAGKSWDELQNHFGPLIELPADRDGKVVAWIKAKGKRS